MIIRSNKDSIIRFSSYLDIGYISSFISEHWKKNHIFCRDTDFLAWHYKDSLYNRINILGEWSKGELLGILGFIPVNHYGGQDIFLSIWKHTKNGGGLKLYNYLIDHVRHDNIYVSGINDKVEKLYKALGFNTGALKHYYRVNENISQDIILNHNENIGKYNPSIKLLKKNKSYINERYEFHPIYKYKIIHLANTDICMCLRSEYVNGSHILRIVDMFIGNRGIEFDDIDSILDFYYAEYIDCQCHGIPEYEMNSIGLRLKTDEIIPEHFHPLKMENIDIKFAIKENKAKRIIIFRGDGDQDRPS